MTTRDDQTGLMNFGAFTFVVDHVVKRASRAGECATVLSIQLGTDLAAPGGEDRPDPAAVYHVARMLRTELRGEDVVARVADREFGVALPDTDAEQGEIVVGWITAKLAEREVGASRPGARGCVVGRATFEPTHGPVPAELLLGAARASLTGPSHVEGNEGRGDRGTGADRGPVAAQRGRSGRVAGRRHLRSLRARDL